MFLEGLGLAIFLEKWGIREHHESLWSCVCLVEIDDKFKRVEMNLSSGNEYLTYFEFMKLYRVDKKKWCMFACEVMDDDWKWVKLFHIMMMNSKWLEDLIPWENIWI